MSDQTNIPNGPCLVWSNEHDAWWRPRRCGYTTEVLAAGVYTAAEALTICQRARDWRDGVPESFTMDFDKDGGFGESCSAKRRAERPEVFVTLGDVLQRVRDRTNNTLAHHLLLLNGGESARPELRRRSAERGAGGRRVVSRLVDLSDERRAAKPWLPASDRDVTEGRVVLRVWEGREYPACVKHGAMHRLTSEADLWRCGECGVGCEFAALPSASPPPGPGVT